MALTVTNIWTQPPKYAGDMIIAVADVLFDSSYITGGEILPAAQVTGTLAVPNKIIFLDTASASGYLFEFDYVNQKLKVRYSTNSLAAHSHTATENVAVAYTQNAAITTATGGAITAAPGAEVVNAGNLATVTVRVLAFLV